MPPLKPRMLLEMRSETNNLIDRRSVCRRQLKAWVALLLCIFWVAAAHSLQYASTGWLTVAVDKLQPIRHLFISKIIEVRVMQGDYPLVYAVYCYWVLPIYLICFFLVAGSFPPKELKKIPEAERSAASFYLKRSIAFAAACYVMIMTSFYLPHYFISQRQASDVTMLAIFDVIRMACQAIFFGMFIFSVREYRNERKNDQASRKGD